MIEYQQFNSNRKDYHDIRLWYTYSYPPHLHQSHELIVMLCGTMELTVEGVREVLHEGQVALILSNKIHSFNIHDNSVACIHVFSPDVVEQFSRLLGTRSGTHSVFECDQDVWSYLSGCISKMTMGVKTDSRKESTISVELYNGSSLMPQILSLTSYLYAVCQQYLSKIPLTAVVNQDTGIAHKVMLYISENFAENITLEDIAEKLGYEPHYISRCFNKTTGTNMKNLINTYRINYAKHLLANPDEKIADIALQCGFQSIRNFNRVFKKVEGRTPKEYRCGL